MVDKTKTSYIVGFAALVCGIFGSVVAVAAVQLKPLQTQNKILETGVLSEILARRLAVGK